MEKVVTVKRGGIIKKIPENIYKRDAERYKGFEVMPDAQRQTEQESKKGKGK